MRNKLFQIAVICTAALSLDACRSVRTTEGGAVGVDRVQTMSALVSAKTIGAGRADRLQAGVGQGESKGHAQ